MPKDFSHFKQGTEERRLLMSDWRSRRKGSTWMRLSTRARSGVGSRITSECNQCLQCHQLSLCSLLHCHERHDSFTLFFPSFIGQTTQMLEKADLEVARSKRVVSKERAPCPICGLVMGVTSLSTHQKYQHGEVKRPPRKIAFKNCAECGKSVRADTLKVSFSAPVAVSREEER